MTEKNWKQKAYDKLVNDGWGQGSSGQSDLEGECCVGGAIAWAITGDPGDMYCTSERYEDTKPALDEFVDFSALDSPTEFPEDSIIAWNDRMDTTWDEVNEVMKRFAQAE